MPRSDWCEQHTTIYANIEFFYEKKQLKNGALDELFLSHRICLHEGVQISIYPDKRSAHWLSVLKYRLHFIHVHLISNIPRCLTENLNVMHP